MIVAQRLRKGACGSPRGAKRLVGDAVTTARRLLGKNQLILVRMDSAFYGRGPVHAAIKGGAAAVSVTVRMDKTVKKAIAAIDADAWTTIEYTDAVFDEATGRWISRAEVAEVDFTAFSAQKKADHVPGRLVVRRIPDFNAEKNKAAGQDTLFDTWRFHAFFTTTDPAILDTVAADKTHRHHAVIEQVHADLKHSALAHLPSGMFTANAAWLVLAVIAFNLARAAGTVAAPALAKASTATIRRKLITVPTRVSSSARRITLHLPKAWPWEPAWTALFTRGCAEGWHRTDEPEEQVSELTADDDAEPTALADESEAGVREGRLHDARHTAATVLLVLGVPERTVMGIMGWSSTAMAAPYQHMTGPIRRAVATQVGGLLWPPHRPIRGHLRPLSAACLAPGDGGQRPVMAVSVCPGGMAEDAGFEPARA